MMLKIVLCAYVRSEFSWEINLFCSFLVRHFVFCFFFSFAVEFWGKYIKYVLATSALSDRWFANTFSCV